MREASKEERESNEQKLRAQLEQAKKQWLTLSKEIEKYTDAKVACREKRKVGMAAVTKEYMETHQRIQQSLVNIRNQIFEVNREIRELEFELTPAEGDDKAE